MRSRTLFRSEPRGCNFLFIVLGRHQPPIIIASMQSRRPSSSASATSVCSCRAKVNFSRLSSISSATPSVPVGVHHQRLGDDRMAHPGRLQILLRLMEGEKNVSDLCRDLSMPQAGNVRGITFCRPSWHSLRTRARNKLICKQKDFAERRETKEQATETVSDQFNLTRPAQ
ncbi:ArsR/SmtB family transcription factor [Ruegeria sp. HKCCD7255]|uniref:ArsR/SmtB family transcription factor n=1 Tax=Ruegeria sp. HKCCD7255 TaxID=2683004 RepID=UPI0035304B7F